MTNFEKQWIAQEAFARVEGEFYANFIIKHPNVKLVRVHDSWLFEKHEGYLLFKDELEQFLRERRGNDNNNDTSQMS